MFLGKLKHLLFDTRMPYVVLALIAIGGAGFEVNMIKHQNIQANRILRVWHGDNVKKVHKNHQTIFKYRTQLNAMSDEKNTYLTQSMMSSLIKQEYSKGDFNVKHTKLPNLSKDPQYIRMSTAMMKQTDYDNDRIDHLTQDIHADEQGMRYDHNHGWFTNAEHPQKAKVFTDMTYNGGGAGVLIFIALWFVFCTANFKNIHYKHLKEANAEKSHKKLVSEYGDAEGFNKSDN